jgi:predicted TIM-barrel fold metal-dependent hydrolase
MRVIRVIRGSLLACSSTTDYTDFTDGREMASDRANHSLGLRESELLANLSIMQTADLPPRLRVLCNYSVCYALLLWFSVLLRLGASTPADVASGRAASPDQLLLKDYQPRPIFNVPQTRVERARFPVIDVHSHAYAKNEAEVDRWVRTMDTVGIERTVILTGAIGKRFDDLVALYHRHQSRFELWCGVDYTGFDQPGYGPGAVAELERCFRAGAKGVGELSDKGGGLRGNSGGMHLDDARMDMILGKCADLGLPVNIHVGEDRWMYEPMDRHNDGLMNAFRWRIPERPDVLPHDEAISTLDRAAQRHPRTTFIACHFANCCHDLSILGRMFGAHPNLYADISARFGETAPIPRYVVRFYEKHQDRLLYGTDMGLDAEMYRATFRILETEDEHFYVQDLFNYHWPLHGFGLSDAVLKKLYGANARRILRLKGSE